MKFSRARFEVPGIILQVRNAGQLFDRPQELAPLDERVDAGLDAGDLGDLVDRVPGVWIAEHIHWLRWIRERRKIAKHPLCGGRIQKVVDQNVTKGFGFRELFGEIRNAGDKGVFKQSFALKLNYRLDSAPTDSPATGAIQCCLSNNQNNACHAPAELSLELQLRNYALLRRVGRGLAFGRMNIERAGPAFDHFGVDRNLFDAAQVG